MKRHSGWLAAALLLSVVLACNLSKNNNNANNSNKNSNTNKPAKAQPTRPANADVYVNRVYMAKDKNGQPGAETTSYDPTDHMVHCIIELNKAKKGTEVRYVWKIWDVEGEKITALVHHPGEADVSYITRYVVLVASSYVGMDTGEPTLFESSGRIVTLLQWDVPECGRESPTMLVQG